MSIHTEEKPNFQVKAVHLFSCLCPGLICDTACTTVYLKQHLQLTSRWEALSSIQLLPTKQTNRKQVDLQVRNWERIQAQAWLCQSRVAVPAAPWSRDLDVHSCTCSLTCMTSTELSHSKPNLQCLCSSVVVLLYSISTTQYTPHPRKKKNPLLISKKVMHGKESPSLVLPFTWVI